MKFKNLLFLAILPLVNAAALLPPVFGRIPVGAIKPAGWLRNQAQIQADGLGGHLRDFDSYVAGSIWVEGGSLEYSEMHESAPYWFNSMVAMAFQLGDARLIGEVHDFLNWTLSNQGSDGWLGPEPFVANATIPRLVWPRYLLLLGMVQYAEADPTQTERIVDAFHRFAALAHTIWATNSEGDESQGFQFGYQFVRWEELVYVLQWLHDNYPRDVGDQLIETMQMVRDSGFSWKDDWFVPGIFPTQAVTTFTSQTHGVNTAEALKSEALAYRFTADETDKQNTFDRFDMLYRYHGTVSGTFSADEHIAGLNPSRGTELCAVAEQMFSLSTIYQILGNSTIAERAEKIAFNALPAGILHDWTAHQYDQQVNQISSEVLDPPPWGNNGPNSNVFGFEPNYPCCTVNHPSAYPKFWSNSFVTDNNGASLVHAFLGPFSFSGKLAGNQVKVTVDTLYPFGHTLTYSISASKSFNLKVRIPSWAQTGKSTVAVGKNKPSALKVDPATSFQVVSVPAGQSTVSIVLDSPLTVESRTNGAVAISKGALTFALELSYNSTVAPGLRSAQALGDAERLFPNAPAAYFTAFDNHTQDHTLLPTTEWRLAIDPSTIRVIDKSATTKLPYYAWAPGSSPITMSVKACQIEWNTSIGVATVPPPSPNTCVGKVVDATLVPFAQAKLRLGEMPTMKV
ncbi:hypothetical protein C8J56DRAFT_954591 [Mycena floridula]|nr:hypothetical protein C8J56DRAFT_954591 [Mycena floridula]